MLNVEAPGRFIFCVYLPRILHIRWQDKVPNTAVLDCADMNSMFSILCERHLRWLGHVRRMENGRIPKDLLYGELKGSRSVDHAYDLKMSAGEL